MLYLVVTEKSYFEADTLQDALLTAFAYKKCAVVMFVKSGNTVKITTGQCGSGQSWMLPVCIRTTIHGPFREQSRHGGKECAYVLIGILCLISALVIEIIIRQHRPKKKDDDWANRW